MNFLVDSNGFTSMGVESLVCFFLTHGFTLLSKKYVGIYISLGNVWKYPIGQGDVRRYHAFDHVPSTGEIFISQDYFHLHLSLSMGQFVILLTSIGHFDLLWKLSILTLWLVFLLRCQCFVSKAFTVLNIITLFIICITSICFPICYLSTA